VGCNHHWLARHHWKRRVTHTETGQFRETDQWGRATFNDHVVCHAEYVCQSCGAVRDEGECGCDRTRGNECPVRLEHLRLVDHAHPDVG